MTTYLNKRNEGIGEDQVLEALYRTKERLEQTEVGIDDDGDEVLSEDVWDFGSWRTCTCGHIYGATTNNDEDVPPEVKLLNSLELRITSPQLVDGLYEETMRAVARANGLYVAYGSELGFAVSNATSDYGNDSRIGDQDLLRQRAMKLVAAAIEDVEQRQREAMERAKNGSAK